MGWLLEFGLGLGLACLIIGTLGLLCQVVRKVDEINDGRGE